MLHEIFAKKYQFFHINKTRPPDTTHWSQIRGDVPLKWKKNKLNSFIGDYAFTK